MTVDSTADEVLAEVRGRLGVITLNRPKAHNALTLGMVEQLYEILVRWASHHAVDAVLIRSASERAFCAGGDMRSIGSLPDPADRMTAARAFFGAEYRVNYLINNFPKPYIALMNGIAMGGGLGLSIHGSHRVVSENLRLAMPETILGFFPDVGGAWFLNRCPGMIGRYLGLIGPHIGAADALTAELATNHVPFAAFDRLVADLAAADRLNTAAVDAIIGAHVSIAGGGTLVDRQADIDRLFSGTNLEEAAARIEAAASEAEWIADAQAVLSHASPISLRATWRRMIEGEGQPIERVLSDDFRMGVRMVCGHDFPEGVRAILVDKDQSPNWVPATLAAVTDADIDALLAPFEADNREWHH